MLVLAIDQFHPYGIILVVLEINTIRDHFSNCFFMKIVIVTISRVQIHKSKHKKGGNGIAEKKIDKHTGTKSNQFNHQKTNNNAKSCSFVKFLFSQCSFII